LQAEVFKELTGNGHAVGAVLIARTLMLVWCTVHARDRFSCGAGSIPVREQHHLKK
jgi:hypothetical protein